MSDLTIDSAVDERLADSIVMAIPRSWDGAILVVRDESQGRRHHVRQAICGPNGEIHRPSDEVKSSVQRVVRQCLRRDRMFVSAAFGVGRRTSGWDMWSDVTYEGRAPGVRNVRSMLERHALPSVARQARLGREVADARWRLHLREGRLSFPSLDRTFMVQLLGTVDHESGEWTWGWADPAELPDEIRQSSKKAREYGVRHGCAELVAGTVKSVMYKGHGLAAIGASLCGAEAYYRCPGATATAFVAVHDDILAQTPADHPKRIRELVGKALATGWVTDHRRAMRRGIVELGGKLEADKQRLLEGTLSAGARFRIKYDKAGHVRHVERHF